MKRILVYLLFVFGIFVYGIDVNAQEYNVKELIPVDSVATVSTGKFTYGDFVYNSAVDSKGNSVINFNSIRNNGISKEYVSINILLFDKDEKNIGFLTYCSKKDLDTDYSGFELASQQAVPFSINVSKRYFVGNNLAGDVKYIAVFDDNKYCQIGGYTKYSGLTISEIADGKVVSTSPSTTIDGEEIDLGFLDNITGNTAVIIILIIIGACLLVFVVNGIILNALHKRMYAKTTPMAYIPILCNYISVKMSFGEMVSKFYLVGFFGGAILSVVGINIILMAVNFLAGVSSVVVIIKLITKKYDLFYYEPSIKNNINLKNNINNVSMNNVNVSSGNNNFFNGQVDNSLVEEVSKDDVVDLSYSDVTSNNDFSSGLMNNDINLQSSVSQDNLDSSSGPVISSGGLDFGDIENTNLNSNDDSTFSSTSTNTNNTNDGESDLSKFFK